MYDIQQVVLQSHFKFSSFPIKKKKKKKKKRRRKRKKYIERQKKERNQREGSSNSNKIWSAAKLICDKFGEIG